MDKSDVDSMIQDIDGIKEIRKKNYRDQLRKNIFETIRLDRYDPIDFSIAKEDDDIRDDLIHEIEKKGYSVKCYHNPPDDDEVLCETYPCCTEHHYLVKIERNNG